MKKFSAVRLIKPSHGDSRRESMNMYRAVRGRLGNEKSRHLFDLYEELCRASKVRGKRSENIARTFGAVCVRCVLAGNAQAFRDLADYIEYWPPSEAKESDSHVPFASPTWVSALRFKHYARQRPGELTSDQLGDFIEWETGKRSKSRTLARILARCGIQPYLRKPGPPSQKNVKAYAAAEYFFAATPDKFTRAQLRDFIKLATGKRPSDSLLTRIQHKCGKKPEVGAAARKMNKGSTSARREKARWKRINAARNAASKNSAALARH